MTIHNKINSKANRVKDMGPVNFKEYGHNLLMRIMKRRYSKIMDEALGSRIEYKQDRKTNYFEPRDTDGEDFRGHGAQNFEREQMTEWQRLK